MPKEAKCTKCKGTGAIPSSVGHPEEGHVLVCECHKK